MVHTTAEEVAVRRKKGMQGFFIAFMLFGLFDVLLALADCRNLFSLTGAITF